MGDSLVLQLLLLGTLIVASGLLSGAEAAYFSLGRARLRRIAAQRPEGALAPVVSRPHDLLVTLLVGITLINIGASALATHTAHALFGPRWGLLVELIAMVVLLTTFGEVLPMTLAVKYPERFLAVVERPVRWLEWLLAPIHVWNDAVVRSEAHAVAPNVRRSRHRHDKRRFAARGQRGPDLLELEGDTALAERDMRGERAGGRGIIELHRGDSLGWTIPKLSCFLRYSYSLFRSVASARFPSPRRPPILLLVIRPKPP